MRHLILFCAILFLAGPAKAQTASPADITRASVNAMADYCMPAIRDKKPPVDFALEKNLIDLPPNKAIKFAPDGGRVFLIPTARGNAVMITSKNFEDVCNIAIHRLSVTDFWKAVETSIGAKEDFTSMREKRIEEEKITKREYNASWGGKVVVYITASDSPREGGMQGLITLARVKK